MTTETVSYERRQRRTIPTRRLSLDEHFAQVPKHFSQDGDLIGSHMVSIMSGLFPEGEDFFVRSVRRYRDKIEDPELRRQVSGFIGQESVHGKEHRAFNQRLTELGYRTSRVDRLTKRSLALMWRTAPTIFSLSFTAALEHFTATFAELLMSNEQARQEMGDPVVLNLFLWHALEESEHKAVAFDVYRAVGGPEWLRILTMRIILTFAPVFLGTLLLLSLLRDRATFQRGNLLTSIRRFPTSAAATSGTWRQLRSYNRRGFHPDDRNTEDLVSQWRDTLFGAHGQLVDALAGTTLS